MSSDSFIYLMHFSGLFPVQFQVWNIGTEEGNYSHSFMEDEKNNFQPFAPYLLTTALSYFET